MDKSWTGNSVYVSQKRIDLTKRRLVSDSVTDVPSAFVLIEVIGGPHGHVRSPGTNWSEETLD